MNSLDEHTRVVNVPQFTHHKLEQQQAECFRKLRDQTRPVQVQSSQAVPVDRNNCQYDS